MCDIKLINFPGGEKFIRSGEYATGGWTPGWKEERYVEIVNQTNI